MIPYDLHYVRAATADEAVEAFKTAAAAGKTARYFGGGTEIVTLSRENKFHADVLIDYKRVPECARFDPAAGYYGAAVRLSTITDAEPLNPVADLMARCAGGVADRTVRNSITLGGNVSGQLPYREAVLPFLLFDAQLHLIGPQGRRRAALRELFDKRLRLFEGELVVAFELPGGTTVGAEPATAVEPVEAVFYRRKTKDSRVDYPALTVAMARVGGRLRVASSGAFGYPLWNAAADEALNSGLSAPKRAAAVIEVLEAAGARFKDDQRAGAVYRSRLFLHALCDGIDALEVSR